VALDFGDGRFGTGTLVTQDGYVLTAAHLAISPNRDVTVHLADGREAKGKTQGVYRDLDIGAIKLAENGPWPFVELNPARELPQEQLFVGVAHPLKYRPKTPPPAHVVGIRRIFRGMIWTDFDIDDYSCGGPLVDKDGKLVGVLNRKSPFGGFMFSRVDEAPQFLGRIKNGDVIGNWYPGTGPSFGATALITRDGCRLADLIADGPAAKAGLQAGDILKRVKGKSVVSMEDIQLALADCDPAQEVVFEYQRGRETAEAKVTLGPRVP
jgi:serine protease Do